MKNNISILLTAATFMILLMIPGVSADIWITPDGYGTDLFVSGSYSGTNPLWLIDNGYSQIWMPSAPNGWWNFTNPHKYNVSQVLIVSDGPRLIACNGGGFNTMNATSGAVTIFPITPTTGFINCYGNGGTYPAVIELRYIEQIATPTGPGVQFTGTPKYGFSPLSVNFSATMNTTPTIVRWNYGDGTIVNGSTSKTALHTYSAVGTYTVRLDTYDTTYGWQNQTRTDYITVTNPSGVVVNLDVKNSLTGALISDVSVGIKNTSTGVWRNSTAATGLVYFDSTDPGFLYPLSVNQSITLAANKTGYQSASTTFSIPYDDYRAYLYLVPSTVINATGAGTVVATVVRNSNGVPISGVSITLDTGQIGITNSAGAVTLTNVTAGTRYATASSSGHQTTSQSFTLSAGETKMVLIQMLLDGETPVATYAPVTTSDPLVDTDGDGIGDTPSSVVGNYTPGQLNQKGSSGLMEMIGMVIGLWPLIFIFAFMKFMRDCMS